MSPSLRAPAQSGATAWRLRPMTTPETSSARHEEAELLARIARQDEGAFAELYRRFAPVLYGLTLRMMHDAKDAEDVLQEGFCAIWRKAGSFDDRLGSPMTWAVLILRHKAIDRLRVRQRTEKIAERALAWAGEDFDDSSAQQPAMRERSTLVRGALQALPEEQRGALELAFFSHLTHEEIATRLETPLGTIKARIRRGLLRLRDLLEGRLT